MGAITLTDLVEGITIAPPVKGLLQLRSGMTPLKRIGGGTSFPPLSKGRWRNARASSLERVCGVQARADPKPTLP